MALLPELFLMVAVDVFLAISLLTGLFEEQFPKALPYTYQGAAAFGFLELLVSRDFLIPLQATEATRFWYSVSFMAVAVANVAAVNVYIGFVRHMSGMARVFAGTVTIPVMLACGTFVGIYGTGGSTLELPQNMLLLIVSVAIADAFATIFLVKGPFRKRSRAIQSYRDSPAEPEPTYSQAPTNEQEQQQYGGQQPRPQYQPRAYQEPSTLGYRDTTSQERGERSQPAPRSFRFPYTKKPRPEVRDSDEDRETQ